MKSLKQHLCELADRYYEDEELSDDIYDHPDRLGAGETRVCIEIEINGHTYAVKFAANKSKHNRVEWRLYRDMPKNIRDMMAEAFAISTCGRVIAFELIPETAHQSVGDYDDARDMVREFNDDLNDALEILGFDDREVWKLTHDNHVANIGVRENGDLVWIDYASCN